MVLGFIIFGWPNRTRTYGPTIPERCGNCDNRTYYFLFESRRWFSLFFVPFLPLGRAKRFLLCSICQAGVEIDRTEWRRLKEFTPVRKAFEAGDVTEAEYLAELDVVATELWGQLPAGSAKAATPDENAVESPV